MKSLTFLLSALLLLGCAAVSAAASADDGIPSLERWTRERAQYAAARSALVAGDLVRYDELARRLEDYPLYPYLRYEYLRRELGRISEPVVNDFLAKYGDLPPGQRLRTAWLEQTAEAGRWEAFLRAYRDGLGTAMRCRQARALIATGRSAGLWPKVDELWLTAENLPAVCDPVIAAWRADGQMTRDKVVRRIELAMDKGASALAETLARSLGAADQEGVKRWQRVSREPARELPGLSAAPDDRWSARAFAQGIRRLADSDAQAADRLWQSEGPLYRLEPDEALAVERAIALAMAFQRRPGAAERLARVQAKGADTAVSEWRVREALYRLDWKAVLEAVQAMPPAERDKEEWTYWRGRALDMLGRRDEAAKEFERILGCRCYFGFLAGERLGRPVSGRGSRLALPTERLKAVAAEPGVVRAAELNVLGYNGDARREWRDVLGRLDTTGARAAARLAAARGWADLTLMSVGKAGALDDPELLFPAPYADQVRAAAARQGLDAALVYALMRQESAFHAQARSPVGALGLMQMMPETARATARKNKLPFNGENDLLDPATNITLGTAHLRELLDRFSGDVVFTLAGYNAGAANIERWRATAQTLPGDVWLATITFRETRRYVEHILGYIQNYQRRLGSEPQRLATYLKPVGPGGAAAGAGVAEAAAEVTPERAGRGEPSALTIFDQLGL